MGPRANPAPGVGLLTKLSPVKPRDLVRILRGLGFELVRQKGSHTFWRHTDSRSTVVPVHGGEEISRGLLRKILQDIGVEPEDFERLR
jgi:predicted RNA binding protein YcfA (HicA-like mRNA interferase family)